MAAATPGPATEVDEELAALVRAGCFGSEEEALREALEALFAAKPQLRVESAVQRYLAGGITLGRAAELAGVTRWELQEVLARRGISVEVEARPPEELDGAVALIRRWRG